MKKHQKTSDQRWYLQDKDLASVRGGGISGGGRSLATIGGGVVPDDNGVISSHN